MASFKVGDRVECYPGLSTYPPGVVVRTDEHGTIVMHDDGREGLWSGGLLLIAPAPPVTRPIQPGDYIKDPGPMATIPQTAWAIGDLMVWAGADDRGLVYRVDRFDYGASRYWMVAGPGDKQRRYDAGLWALLPPDAVLDEARSPKRDGKAAFAETVRAASCKHDRSCPIDCAKWSDVIAKVNAQAALLSRALILVSGLNLQHHAVTREQFEAAQGLCRDLVRALNEHLAHP